VWIGCIWLKIGSSGQECKHTNKPSGSIKSGEFLDQMDLVSVIALNFQRVDVKLEIFMVMKKGL
jgi:hypothetical protein